MKAQRCCGLLPYGCVARKNGKKSCAAVRNNRFWRFLLFRDSKNRVQTEPFVLRTTRKKEKSPKMVLLRPIFCRVCVTHEILFPSR